MPKLKRRKDGGYYLHASGDENPINTFQVTDRGAEIVKSSGRELGEFFPDQLFFLLYDLGHLSTKNSGETGGEIIGQDLPSEVYQALSVEDRVQVARKIVQTHGVEELYTGETAKWVCSILDQSTATLQPLVEDIAESAGYSFETILEYSKLVHDGGNSLEIALCADLQIRYLREVATFDVDDGQEREREVLGADNKFVYLKTPTEDTFTFGIPGDKPIEIADDLSAELDRVWSPGIGTAGFAALTTMEVERRYDVDDGIVLPAERLNDFPVALPPRSEVTELYESLRLLKATVDHVLSSPDASVEDGDNSVCDRWQDELEKRLTSGTDGADSLGAQQNSRTDHTVQTYRDCYGNGSEITDYKYIEWSQPSESEQLRLFGFGIFEHGEEVKVPVAPESERPLPVYPQSESELEQAIELLDEFPSKPSA
ncbi:hypothetical protein [Natronomonas salsuginis]|uniref:Uncharacterized protein n=1 Tax=Natronomonas salsuginis TaxID=2217661 RepID=A0A4U5JF51_9EURY|nr:hypothetical protein [Natronomonas salsuginis]TKR27992.1 hypothetical protein DM868_02615 [Natronomonas salsuginis]